MTTLPLRIALGAAVLAALLGGCNKRPTDQPVTPETTTPAPATTPATPTPADTPPPATPPNQADNPPPVKK
jgi:hypothetical protein